MAFSPFTAGLFTAGQILTAAQMNTYIRDNIMAGGPVYATEAARNADIPSPYEGQRAYITGSTETSAAGLITAIPTGIQTIYNGAGWVTVTATGGQTATAGTTTSGVFAALTGGGTNPTATLRTGTTALISLSSVRFNTGANAMYFTFGVTGATTILPGTGTAGSFNSITNTAAPTSSTGGQYGVITGLTAGVNIFTLSYATAGGTGTFQDRFITVQGIA